MVNNHYGILYFLSNSTEYNFLLKRYFSKENPPNNAKAGANIKNA